jgi:CDP-paratose 2-epimerase
MSKDTPGRREGFYPGQQAASTAQVLRRMGVVEYFRPGEHERVESVLARLRALGVERVRTSVSWAECHTDEGAAWYDWLLPRLAKDVEVLPCFAYTPPSLGVVAKTSAPPRDPKTYADFLDVMLSRHGRHFAWIELWNEPNNINDWDWRLDHEWLHFSKMIGGAAYWIKHRGWKTVLGGTCPTDLNWLRLMCRRGIMSYIDAVGIHGFPGTWDCEWPGWKVQIKDTREALQEEGHSPQIWITESGYSTWNQKEAKQVSAFMSALHAEADRMYWYSFQDLHGDLDSQEGFHFDERHYHTGMLKADGTRKLLYRVIERTAEQSSTLARAALAPRVRPARRSVLITGGAGFIGANLADRLAEQGHHVIIYDSLARDHVEENLEWLASRHGPRVAVEVADIRDFYALRDTVRHASQVYHLAAQVAVTTSIDNPMHDFEVNARGALNLLEALRACAEPPPLVFTSTNKVYGRIIGNAGLVEGETRHTPAGNTAKFGFAEFEPLDFCSPYGCSKGAADQYVQDYARVYGLATAVFRMSCIYGPRQFGTEDQGWVAHFVRAALEERPVVIYGDGKQVRDILFIDDLIDALLRAQEQMPALSGQAFNIGGGPANTISLIELLALIEQRTGTRPERTFRSFRAGDQLYYVSDIRRFCAATGWRPRVGVADGLDRLTRWIESRFNPERRLPAKEMSA